MSTGMQGDRKAGPSLSAFNYESVWGQRALKRLFKVIMGVSHPQGAGNKTKRAT